jgi:cytochrome P450
MRYVEALLMEVLRISSLVPMSVFHGTMADVEFHGYRIPMDTTIIPNLYSVHWNKETWIDPENFRPERFLSADGKTILKNDSLIPFAVGKRQCIGETLARDELFLYLTSIFQKFVIKPDPANPTPSLEPNTGFVLTAPPYSVVMKDRLS